MNKEAEYVKWGEVSWGKREVGQRGAPGVAVLLCALRGSGETDLS